MKKLSKSERLGALSVALIALLISAVGFGVSRCDREQRMDAPVVKEVYAPDTVRVDKSKDKSSGKKGKNSRSRKKGATRKSRALKKASPVPQRDPLSDTIPLAR